MSRIGLSFVIFLALVSCQPIGGNQSECGEKLDAVRKELGLPLISAKLMEDKVIPCMWLSSEPKNVPRLGLKHVMYLSDNTLFWERNVYYNSNDNDTVQSIETFYYFQNDSSTIEYMESLKEGNKIFGVRPVSVEEFESTLLDWGIKDASGNFR